MNAGFGGEFPIDLPDGGAGQPATCVPSPACGEVDPTCDEGFSAECDAAGYAYCCDADRGVVGECHFADNFRSSEEYVVANDCTATSYGEQPCSASCLGANDPPCDVFGDCKIEEYCSDPSIGYRMRCLAGADFDETAIVCVCDPLH
jgi:hypothetical protein